MPGSALQQQGLGVFANLLAQPTASQRVFQQQMAGGVPGMDILSAAQPIFQRNQGEALARLQQSGPRFASATQREGRLLEQQGLQDFNLFQQNVLESGRNRQLQAAMGADNSILNLLSGAGQFAQGAQNPQLALLGQLLPALFGGGLSGGIAVGPSPFGQLSQAGTSIASLGMMRGGGGGR